MDLATLIGTIGGIVALVFCVITSGGSMSGIIDVPSLIFVVGGSFFALFHGASIGQVLGMLRCIGRAYKTFNFGAENIIKTLVSLSEKARREGILALEEGIEEVGDEFLKSGIRLVVDGTDGNVIRAIMESDMSQCEGRHMDVIAILNFWGSVGPGFGMMGTVIGLIGMLRNLEDKSSLGPNMAVALITTLYGSLLVNWMFSPWSQKLLRQNSAEMSVKEIIIEGVLSIQAGDNPRILAQKLLTYLEPAKKTALAKEIMND